MPPKVACENVPIISCGGRGAPSKPRVAFTGSSVKEPAGNWENAVVWQSSDQAIVWEAEKSKWNARIFWEEIMG